MTPLSVTPLAAALLAATLPEPEIASLAEAAQSRFLHDDCGIYALAVTETNDLGLLGSTTLAASATARLEGDRWTLLDHRMDDPGNNSSMVYSSVGDVSVPFVLPLLGVFDEGDSDGDLAGEGRALLDQAVAVARSDASTEWAAEEDFEGRAHYRLDMVLGGGWSLWRGREENTAAVVVDPVSGRARAWRLAIHDPTKLGAGRLVFLDATLSVDPAGRPLDEVLRARARLGPFGLTVDRAVAYTRTGDCPAPPPEAPPAQAP